MIAEGAPRAGLCVGLRGHRAQGGRRHDLGKFSVLRAGLPLPQRKPPPPAGAAVRMELAGVWLASVRDGTAVDALHVEAGCGVSPGPRADGLPQAGGRPGDSPMLTRCCPQTRPGSEAGGAGLAGGGVHARRAPPPASEPQSQSGARPLGASTAHSGRLRPRTFISYDRSRHRPRNPFTAVIPS